MTKKELFETELEMEMVILKKSNNHLFLTSGVRSSIATGNQKLPVISDLSFTNAANCVYQVLYFV